MLYDIILDVAIGFLLGLLVILIIIYFWEYTKNIKIPIRRKPCTLDVYQLADLVNYWVIDANKVALETLKAFECMGIASLEGRLITVNPARLEELSNIFRNRQAPPSNLIDVGDSILKRLCRLDIKSIVVLDRVNQQPQVRVITAPTPFARSISSNTDFLESVLKLIRSMGTAQIGDSKVIYIEKGDKALLIEGRKDVELRRILDIFGSVDIPEDPMGVPRWLDVLLKQ